MTDRRAAGAALMPAGLLLAGLLLPPAARGAELAPNMGDPVRGQALFAGKGCVKCHAVRGAGGRIGPDLGRTAAKSSFYEIAAGMWNHSPGMDAKVRELRQVRPVFAAGELRDLVTFIYFLNYFDEPGDPRLGQILFTEKHCIQCHRVADQGGTSGPRLDSLPRGVSPLRIAQGLWNHGPQMVASMQRQGLGVPQFRGSEIIDLFAYLRSQGRGRESREFQSPGDPEAGSELFSNKGCSRCHDVFGREWEIGPDLGEAGLRGSVTQIAGRMWNHWSAMAEAMAALEMRPPVFEGDDLADLLAFLFVSRFDGQAGDPGRGLRVYRDKGCAFCHGVEGEGTLARPLRDSMRGRDKESIVREMWNRAPEMAIEMGGHQLPWPRFEAQELSDLLAFLRAGWPEAENRRADPEG